jgi:energy-coupling factor transporter ATP-binding protein EcfA2
VGGTGGRARGRRLEVPLTAVALDRLGFRYAGAGTNALENVSVAVAPGEICWLYGRPGAGTSTLLLAVAGLAPRLTGGTVSGAVMVLGADPQTDDGRAALRGRIAHASSAPDLQLSGIGATVREEVAFAPANLSWPIERVEDAAARALDRLGIRHLAERHPAALSGGEKQRVVLASLAVLEPAVWLLDDAGSALDAEGRRILADLIRAEAARGAAVLVASEDADAMAGLASRVLLFDAGALAWDGAPRALLSQELAWERGPGSTAVAELARAAWRHSAGARFAPAWPLDPDDAAARWS